MSATPEYDSEALKDNIKREDENIALFMEEIKKAKKRKIELEFLLKQVEQKHG